MCLICFSYMLPVRTHCTEATIILCAAPLQFQNLPPEMTVKIKIYDNFSSYCMSQLTTVCSWEAKLGQHKIDKNYVSCLVVGNREGVFFVCWIRYQAFHWFSNPFMVSPKLLTANPKKRGIKSYRRNNCRKVDEFILRLLLSAVAVEFKDKKQAHIALCAFTDKHVVGQITRSRVSQFIAVTEARKQESDREGKSIE